ncbi:hypothetical protein ACJMK2_012080 [Sinanodonta woodiana]|uniref:Uncharacterized protein n=1 Tax=Sinanodonta woodiana TaxID=1069815 RepID=A0ABD3V718_SINWO
MHSILKAGDDGVDDEDYVLMSDLYVSSSSDSDNESKELVDDRTSWKRGIKRRENKSGLPGRFRRYKRHKDSDDTNVCSLDESEGKSNKIDIRLIDWSIIESSVSKYYDNDSHERDLDNSSTGSSSSQCGNYKKETSTLETDDKMEDNSGIKRFNCDLLTHPVERLNADVSLDDYGRNEHVSTYHTEQSETNFLDIMINEDEDNFTDYGDVNYSDDNDISESSSDEETEKVSTADAKLSPILRRMKVLVPLRVILLKYRTIRDASRDWSSCCSQYCWRDWPLRKLLSAMDDYSGL